MLNIIKLIIPALLPSWNFFDYITPSPRIEYTLLQQENEASEIWQAYRPHPENLTIFQMIKRLFWNSHWNETMFVMGLAERLAANYTSHSENEIFNRIIQDLNASSSVININDFAYIQFRLVFIEREGKILNKEISFHSSIKKLPEVIINVSDI